MSFFKKLKDELKEMLDDDKDKDKHKVEAHGDHGPSGYGNHGAESTRDHGSYGQNPAYGAAPPQAYGQPPQPYGQPPQGYGQQYPGSPPPPGGYGAPPPGPPQLPPGWVMQWDANSQRNYYLEQATGRTQWEPPQWHGGPPAPPHGSAGYYNSYGGAMPMVPPQGGHMENTRDYYAQGPQGAPYGHHEKEKKGHGMGTVVAAGVGGAVLGAVAANALSDSDDEHAAAAPAPYGAPPAAYGAPPPPAEPPLEYNPELSSSQRSSLQEAREDLAEAEAAAADSDASSSDLEELREAQEEYASEVESAHEELED